jgi:hypothetical protein
MSAAQRSAAMAGYCPSAANRELLIYVSFLSGSFRHRALVKIARTT